MSEKRSGESSVLFSWSWERSEFISINYNLRKNGKLLLINVEKEIKTDFIFNQM